MNIQKKLLNIIVVIATWLTLLSCNATKRMNKDFNYFQNGLDSVQTNVYVEPRLKINDVIKIQVIAGSLKQEDATLFNMVASSAMQSGNMMYTIDNLGNIEMPKIGKIKAANMTAMQLADTIQKLLVNEIKSPLVFVSKFVKFKVNVLGEVKKPGVALFQIEKVNILEAIAEAGDLTDNGKREDILVMRKVDDKYETYKIDLRNTAFMKSPAFYLQENDVVYVGANRAKLLSVGRDPNSERNFQLALQVLSTVSVLLNTVIILKRL